MNDETNTVAANNPESEELVAYLDGELDTDSCARIERKLGQDANYRRSLQSLQEAWELLDHLPSPAVSESFVQTTVQMVAVSAAADNQDSNARAAKRQTKWFAICSIAILTAAVGGFGGASLFFNRADNALLHDLPIIDNLDVYRHAESLAFLQQLHESGLFQQEAENAAPESGNAGQESLAQRRAGIDAMSRAEQDAVRRRWEKFVGLDDKEQQRIETLHKQLNNDPRSSELLKLAKCYSDWVKTLDSRQRAELLSLSAEEKIVRIEELRQEQQKLHFSEIVSRELSDHDLKAIFHWLDGFFTRHEEAWLAELPRDVRTRLERTHDARHKRHALARAMMMHTKHFPRPNAGEEEELLAMLSAEARKSFRQAQQVQGQGKLIEEWIRVAVFTRVMGSPSEDELKEFLTKRLDPRTRNQLEELPPDEMRAKLRRLYYGYKFRSWPGSHGVRPPRGRSGFRYGSGPPAGAEHRRPPFAPGRGFRIRGEENAAQPDSREDKAEQPNNGRPRSRSEEPKK